MTKNCLECGKKIGLFDEHPLNGKLFCFECFSKLLLCSHCNKKLQYDDYKTSENLIFCRSCFTKNEQATAVKKIVEEQAISVNYICVNCHCVGQPKTKVKGSFFTELLLWLVIIPGLIYSVWRLTTKQKVCPQCDAPNMIPTSTPRGQKLQKELGQRSGRDIPIAEESSC